MRWLFHLVRDADLGWGADGRYRPASLDKENFVHASFQNALAESARLYFREGENLRVLAIDPRRLDVPVEIAETPRGPMPHVHGSIPVDAVTVLDLEGALEHADEVTGTRIALMAFAGMTLLDLVGPLDVLSRIGSMGFDATTRCEVIGLSADDEEGGVWTGSGAQLRVGRYRPSLDDFDLLVVPGGPSTGALEHDREVIAYLRTYPINRLLASVCTGALLLGAAGRLAGCKATTHESAMERLREFGATPVVQRVVDEGQIITSGGVTAGIDLGLHLAKRLAGDAAAKAIAHRISWHSA